MNGIELRLSPVKALKTTEIGNQYHLSLKRICSTVRKSYPELKGCLILKLVIAVINDTMDTEGFGTIALGFWRLSFASNSEKPSI